MAADQQDSVLVLAEAHEGRKILQLQPLYKVLHIVLGLGQEQEKDPSTEHDRDQPAVLDEG